MSDLAFVGTRTTAKRNALGRGIEVFDVSAEPWRWVETLPATNPSFLALDRKRSVLHAVHGDMTMMSSYAVRCDNGPGNRILEPLGERSTEGENPAHIVIDPTGQWLIVTNHSSGTVASFRITGNGEPEDAADVLAFTGKPGPFSEDQTGAKPHQTVFIEELATTATGTETRISTAIFLVPDKGLDTIFRCALDLRTGELSVIDQLQLRQGCGPRHLVLHPNADIAYVLGELGNTVTVITGVKTPTQSAMTAIQVLPTLPADDVRDSRGGEIVINNSGQTVWITNRSGAGDSTPGGPDPDTVATFSVEDDGRLGLDGHTSLDGIRPRFALLDHDKASLNVALERSHRIVRVEDAHPRLVTLANVSSPVCVVLGAMRR